MNLIDPECASLVRAFQGRTQRRPPAEVVAAGGRYDSLLRRMGAPKTASAVGCMVRPARAWNGAA